MAMPNYMSADSLYGYHQDIMRKQIEQHEQQKRQMMREMQMMNKDPYGSYGKHGIGIQAPQQPEPKAQDKRLLLLEV